MKCSLVLRISNALLFTTFFFAVSAQQLNPSQAVKTLDHVYSGDLNNMQNWGGTGVYGMYIFNSHNTANSPALVAANNNWMHVIEMQHDQGNNNWMAQIAVDYFNDGGLYWRQEDDHNWRSWRKAASEEWVTQQLATGSFLPLTGGTVNGNVGIGVPTPSAKLHVSGTIRLADPNSPDNGSEIKQNGSGLEIRAGATSGGALSLITGGSPYGSDQFTLSLITNMFGGTTYSGLYNSGSRSFAISAANGLSFHGGGQSTSSMFINTNGNVGIGTVDPGSYKLAVDGKIGARKIVITQASGWADFVFDPNYKLRSLSELSIYIQANKHLPEVPSAAIMEKNGIDVGETQKLMMQKIEELTLYIIDQDKKIEDLRKELLKVKPIENK